MFQRILLLFLISNFLIVKVFAVSIDQVEARLKSLINNLHLQANHHDLVRDPFCKSPTGLCFYDVRTGHFLPPPYIMPTGSLTTEIDILFTEGVLRDELATFAPPSSYTEAEPLIIRNRISGDFFSPSTIFGQQTKQHCPAGAHCVKLEGTRVPTLVVTTSENINADLTVYLFCDDRDLITERPFGRPGQGYRAEFLSEPTRRSMGCRRSGTISPSNFILSFQPGADIFLPPWQLHVPIPWDKFFFDEYAQHRPFKLLNWDDKAKLALSGAVRGFESGGRNRLALFVADNCERITRTEWVRKMMAFSPHLVDSTGTCLHNRQVPPEILAWNWDPHLGVTYGWERFFQMYAQKLLLSSQYFFHLAFENDLDDPMWITEKFIGAFLSGSLPVLMGPSKWSYKFLPVPHSAIFYSSFQDAEALSRYLIDLAANRTAYDEYLSWRLLPIQKLNPNFLSMFDTTRRYRIMNMLSNFASFADLHPEIAHRSRVHVPRIGFIDEGRLNLVQFSQNK